MKLMRANIFQEFIQHRFLISQLTKKDITQRYRGSALGFLWSILSPLFTLAIYTFVFGFIFKAKWGIDTGESKADFALILFSGLIFHAMMTECLTAAPTLMSTHSNFVKRVVFPLEILPWTTLLSSLYHFMMSFAVLVFFYIVVNQTFPVGIIFVPIIMIPFCILLIGLMWILSSLGVFFKDLSQIMQMASTLLLFTSPILYPLSMVPEKLHFLIYLNPLTLIIEQMRDILFHGSFSLTQNLLLYLSISCILAIIARNLFKKLKLSFADLL